MDAEQRHKAMLWRKHLKELEEREHPKVRRAKPTQREAERPMAQRKKLTLEEKKERRRASVKAYRERNLEKIREYNREWQRKKRASMTEEELQSARDRLNAWQRERYATDPEYRAKKLAHDRANYYKKKAGGA